MDCGAWPNRHCCHSFNAFTSSCQPKIGTFGRNLPLLACLKQHNHSSIVFDHTAPCFDESHFQKCDWSEHCPDAEEPEPPGALELLGEPAAMTCFIDADHTGCWETRHSQTGILVFIQRALVVWCTKKQNTVKSAYFISEFCAMRVAVDLCVALH